MTSDSQSEDNTITSISGSDDLWTSGATGLLHRHARVLILPECVLERDVVERPGRETREDRNGHPRTEPN